MGKPLERTGPVNDMIPVDQAGEASVVDDVAKVVVRLRRIRN